MATVFVSHVMRRCVICCSRVVVAIALALAAFFAAPLPNGRSAQVGLTDEETLFTFKSDPFLQSVRRAAQVNRAAAASRSTANAKPASEDVVSEIDRLARIRGVHSLTNGSNQVGVTTTGTDAGQMKIRQVRFTSYKLANGLRVLLAPDETASGIAVNLSFDVGSRNEAPEQAGLANLLQNIISQNLNRTIEGEHELSRVEDSKQLQATINQERTSYFSEVTRSKLDFLLLALARQMSLPDITQTRVDEQLVVILGQCKQASEGPFGRVQAMLLELSYQKFAYKHDTICSLPDDNRVSHETIRRFFKTHYGPNNAVLVIAGDFRENDIKKAVKKHFALIPRQAAPPHVDVTNEPPITLERRQIISNSRATSPFYMSAYLTVPSDHADWYALNLLGDILGQGSTARLYTALVAQKLASAVPEGASELRGQSLFRIGARVLPGVSVEKVEAIIDAEIAQIQANGVTEGEMVKARSQERDYAAEQIRTPLGKANVLARAAIYYHDPNRINTELDRMLTVSAEDVRRVAQKYLVRTNRAVVIVQPID